MDGINRVRATEAGRGLLACPFCGGVGDLVSQLRAGYELYMSDPDSRAYFVRCRSCATEGPWAKTDAGAIRQWNTRPIEVEAAKAEREWLRGILNDHPPFENPDRGRALECANSNCGTEDWEDHILALLAGTPEDPR